MEGVAEIATSIKLGPGLERTRRRGRFLPARPAGTGHAGPVSDVFDGILDRYTAASAGFERTLRAVRPGQWHAPTPCTEWDVRLLANHMTRGNLTYVGLAAGGRAADFLRLRNTDALGEDPVGSYTASVRQCAEAFAGPAVLDMIIDYPLGRIPGRQALAVRTADSLIHTWDLARAIGADDTLDPGLVAWTDTHLEEIYAGLVETPTAADTTHRYFAAPATTPDGHTSRQDRLLIRMGRNP